LIAATALYGCGGNGNSRRYGTTDSRILGQWRPISMQVGEATTECPGDLVSGDVTYACSDDIDLITADGRIADAEGTERYFFDGTTLTIYASPVITEQVVFTNNDNRMSVSSNGDGVTRTIVFERVIQN